MMGVPAIIYDGDNAEAVVKAMGLEEGDAVVTLEPHKTIILRASQLDMMRRQVVDFDSFRRNFFPTPRKRPLGLIRRLLSPEI